ncbi:unnamed protein product [Phytophthora fragariaefolia]|uniref:Unnamed protein product n=1 Tax=Phytophthora fragariaefolia TaxID=1490495 RepID=A0A9W6XLG1_9STRA|nr:unnamed protein product [Phytophthora fragariaefolia]
MKLLILTMFFAAGSNKQYAVRGLTVEMNKRNNALQPTLEAQETIGPNVNLKAFEFGAFQLQYPQNISTLHSSANSAIASEPRLLARAATKLQHKDGVTLRDVRVLFDKLLDEVESAGTCSKHLAVASKVVAVHDFENAIVKVQEGRSRELSKVVEQAIPRLLGSPTVLEEDVRGSLGFADAALLGRRVTVRDAIPQLGLDPADV